ncbi:unnamed protein product [Penicillium discolor]
MDQDEDETEDNAWFDHQLVGLDVVRDETVVGRVVRVEHLPAQDLLIVKPSTGGADEVMVPFVEAIARGSGLLDLQVHDLRDWTHDRHRTVDDTPYGGGAGMVMKPEPWGLALDELTADVTPAPTIIFPSPAGEVFTQATARDLAGREHLVFGCGRYEGIDERVFDNYVQGRASQLICLLEYPSYTKPSVWRERAVPDVLLSGNHGAIAAWRREQQLVRTRLRRPDLLPDAPTDG